MPKRKAPALTASTKSTVFSDACESLSAKLGAFSHKVSDSDDTCSFSVNTFDRIGLEHFTLFHTVTATLKLDSNTLSIEVVRSSSNNNYNNNKKQKIIDDADDVDRSIVRANVKHLSDHFEWVGGTESTCARATEKILNVMRLQHKRSWKLNKCVTYSANNGNNYLFIFNARDSTQGKVEPASLFEDIHARFNSWVEAVEAPMAAASTPMAGGTGRRLRLCLAIGESELDRLGRSCTGGGDGGYYDYVDDGGGDDDDYDGAAPKHPPASHEQSMSGAKQAGPVHWEV